MECPLAIRGECRYNMNVEFEISLSLHPSRLLNHMGELKISDFGLARKLGQDDIDGDGDDASGGSPRSDRKQSIENDASEGKSSSRRSVSGAARTSTTEERDTREQWCSRSENCNHAKKRQQQQLQRPPPKPREVGEGKNDGGQSRAGAEHSDAASERDGTPSLHRAHTFVGTITYMSPERINGEGYSYASDVWSLGMSLITTALGKMPLDTKHGYWSVLHSIR